MNGEESEFQFSLDPLGAGLGCPGCERLQKLVDEQKEEKQLNYKTLKQKIISTDQLIKRYRTKCEVYDQQSKMLEDVTRKLERSKRETETVNSQLQTALQQLEPLKKQVESLTQTLKRKDSSIQMLDDKLQAAEMLRAQFEAASRVHDSEKQKMEKEEKERKSLDRRIDSLETAKQKLDMKISRLKAVNKELKNENKSLEKQLKKSLKMNVGAGGDVIYKVRKGSKKSNNKTGASSDDSIRSIPFMSSDNTDTEQKEMVGIMEEDSHSEDEVDIYNDFMMSPLNAMLSPLPPTPQAVSTEEEDDGDDFMDTVGMDLLLGSGENLSDSDSGAEELDPGKVNEKEQTELLVTSDISDEHKKDHETAGSLSGDGIMKKTVDLSFHDNLEGQKEKTQESTDTLGNSDEIFNESMFDLNASTKNNSNQTNPVEDTKKEDAPPLVDHSIETIHASGNIVTKEESTSISVTDKLEETATEELGVAHKNGGLDEVSKQCISVEVSKATIEDENTTSEHGTDNTVVQEDSKETERLLPESGKKFVGCDLENGILNTCKNNNLSADNNVVNIEETITSDELTWGVKLNNADNGTGLPLQVSPSPPLNSTDSSIEQSIGAADKRASLHMETSSAGQSVKSDQLKNIIKSPGPEDSNTNVTGVNRKNLEMDVKSEVEARRTNEGSKELETDVRVAPVVSPAEIKKESNVDLSNDIASVLDSAWTDPVMSSGPATENKESNGFKLGDEGNKPGRSSSLETETIDSGTVVKPEIASNKPEMTTNPGGAASNSGLGMETELCCVVPVETEMLDSQSGDNSQVESPVPGLKSEVADVAVFEEVQKCNQKSVKDDLGDKLKLETLSSSGDKAQAYESKLFPTSTPKAVSSDNTTTMETITTISHSTTNRIESKTEIMEKSEIISSTTSKPTDATSNTDPNARKASSITTHTTPRVTVKNTTQISSASTASQQLDIDTTESKPASMKAAVDAAENGLTTLSGQISRPLTVTDSFVAANQRIIAEDLINVTVTQDATFYTNKEHSPVTSNQNVSSSDTASKPRASSGLDLDRKKSETELTSKSVSATMKTSHLGNTGSRPLTRSTASLKDNKNLFSEDKNNCLPSTAIPPTNNPTTGKHSIALEDAHKIPHRNSQEFKRQVRECDDNKNIMVSEKSAIFGENDSVQKPSGDSSVPHDITGKPETVADDRDNSKDVKMLIDSRIQEADKLGEATPVAFETITPVADADEDMDIVLPRRRKKRKANKRRRREDMNKPEEQSAKMVSGSEKINQKYSTENRIVAGPLEPADNDTEEDAGCSSRKFFKPLIVTQRSTGFLLSGHDLTVDSVPGQCSKSKIQSSVLSSITEVPSLTSSDCLEDIFRCFSGSASPFDVPEFHNPISPLPPSPIDELLEGDNVSGMDDVYEPVKIDHDDSLENNVDKCGKVVKPDQDQKNVVGKVSFMPLTKPAEAESSVVTYLKHGEQVPPVASTSSQGRATTEESPLTVESPVEKSQIVQALEVQEGSPNLPKLNRVFVQQSKANVPVATENKLSAYIGEPSLVSETERQDQKACDVKVVSMNSSEVADKHQILQLVPQSTDISIKPDNHGKELRDSVNVTNNSRNKRKSAEENEASMIKKLKPEPDAVPETPETPPLSSSILVPPVNSVQPSLVSVETEVSLGPTSTPATFIQSITGSVQSEALSGTSPAPTDSSVHPAASLIQEMKQGMKNDLLSLMTTGEITVMDFLDKYFCDVSVAMTCWHRLVLIIHEVLKEVKNYEQPRGDNSLCDSEHALVLVLQEISSRFSSCGLQFLLDVLWQSAIEESTDLSFMTSICRVYVSVCKLIGDLEQVRVLLYEIILTAKNNHNLVSIVLVIVNVWPLMIDRDFPKNNIMSAVIEHVVIKESTDYRQSHPDDFSRLCKLCGWSGDLQVNNNKKLLSKIIQMLKDHEKHPHRLHEIKAALRLLLMKENWMFLNSDFINVHVSSGCQKWCCSKVMPYGVDPVYLVAILKVLGDVLVPENQDFIKIRSHNILSLLTVYLLPILNKPTPVTSVTDCVVDLILKLSPFAPQLAMTSLYKWYKKMKAVIPQQLKSRLQQTKNLLFENLHKFPCAEFT